MVSPKAQEKGSTPSHIWCGEFEVFINAAAISFIGTSNSKPHQKPIIARAPLIPKFASKVAPL